MTGEHESYYETDESGWEFVGCECGWSSGPYLSREDAGDAFADHLAWAASTDHADPASGDTP